MSILLIAIESPPSHYELLPSVGEPKRPSDIHTYFSYMHLPFKDVKLEVPPVLLLR